MGWFTLQSDGTLLRGDGKIIYGSWKDGSDVMKDKKGYYVIQWNPNTQSEYHKYLPKSWKPDLELASNKLQTKKSKKTKKKTSRKTRKH